MHDIFLDVTREEEMLFSCSLNGRYFQNQSPCESSQSPWDCWHRTETIVHEKRRDYLLS